MGNTIQRKRILETVNNSMEHNTVEEIHEKVLLEIPNISLGTVYRNLNILVEQEMIRPIHIKNQPIRYDSIHDEHDHLICSKCYKVEDIPSIKLDYSSIKDITSEIDSHTILLYHVCNECKNKLD